MALGQRTQALILVLLLAIGCSTLPAGVNPGGEQAERTLWKVCVTGSQVEVNPDRPPHAPLCADWRYIRYQFPIRVGVSENLVTSILRTSVIDQWNQWMGFPLLVPTTSYPDITIRLIDNTSIWWAGYANPIWNNGRFQCSATLNIARGSSVPHRILLHEFGHCLGLAHDGTNKYPGRLDSIMKQGAKNPYYRLTDADREAISRLYSVRTY